MGPTPLAVYTAQGVVQWRSLFSLTELQPLIEAAAACFEQVEAAIATHGPAAASQHLPPEYDFNPYSTAVHLDALDAFLPSESSAVFWWQQTLQHCPELLNFCQQVGGFSQMLRSQLRVRKQYAPGRGHQFHQPNQWHQDGGLRVQFPAEPDAPPYCTTPLTPLLTLWLPLTACGRDAPSLELICSPQTQLLHYQTLNDQQLHRLFSTEQFWTPELAVGDALLFDCGAIHRTAVTESMGRNRLSLECRFFNPQQIPAAFSNETWLTLF